MNTGRTFFWLAFMPQAFWLFIIAGLTFCGVIQLWPEDCNYKILVPAGFATAIVAIILATHFDRQSNGAADGKGGWPLFFAGSIQIAALFWTVKYTGGLDGSPFSFYYLYIPSIVGVTFFSPAILKPSCGLFKRIYASKGTRAALFTAIFCGICVYLHIFEFPSDWTPVSTITTSQRDVLASLSKSSIALPANARSVIMEISESAKPLEGQNVLYYRIVRFCTFLIPLIMGLVTYFSFEGRSALGRNSAIKNAREK